MTTFFMGRKLQLLESEIMVGFFGHGSVFYLVLAVTSLEGSQWPCLDQLVIRSLWSYKFVGFLSSPRFMIPTFAVYRWREGKQSSILNPQPMVDWRLRLAVNHPKSPSWREILLEYQPQAPTIGWRKSCLATKKKGYTTILLHDIGLGGSVWKAAHWNIQVSFANLVRASWNRLPRH